MSQIRLKLHNPRLVASWQTLKRLRKLDAPRVVIKQQQLWVLRLSGVISQKQLVELHTKYVINPSPEEQAKRQETHSKFYAHRMRRRIAYPEQRISQ